MLALARKSVASFFVALLLQAAVHGAHVAVSEGGGQVLAANDDGAHNGMLAGVGMPDGYSDPTLQRRGSHRHTAEDDYVVAFANQDEPAAYADEGALFEAENKPVDVPFVFAVPVGFANNGGDQLQGIGVPYGLAVGDQAAADISSRDEDNDDDEGDYAAGLLGPNGEGSIDINLFDALARLHGTSTRSGRVSATATGTAISTVISSSTAEIPSTTSSVDTTSTEPAATSTTIETQSTSSDDIVSSTSTEPDALSASTTLDAITATETESATSSGSAKSTFINSSTAEIPSTTSYQETTSTETVMSTTSKASTSAISSLVSSSVGMTMTSTRMQITTSTTTLAQSTTKPRRTKFVRPPVLLEREYAEPTEHVTPAAAQVSKGRKPRMGHALPLPVPLPPLTAWDPSTQMDGTPAMHPTPTAAGV
ncbi:hypothetical protein BC831DRAFT_444816 [Entophlyctis helioformis]|nr:hypothetical protein BC831DRAFT_444816 [Entophlyctis helioformis]